MNIAIVEDDSACAEQIATFIRLYSNENKLQLSSTTFSDGVSFLSPYQPVFDLILMDIDMPLVDGLQAAREIREMDSDVGIVFVTALAQYAMAGYEVHALDYMLKPLDYRSFALRMERILRRLEELQRIRTASILIRSRNDLRKIHCRDLLYVDVVNHTLTYHTTKGDFSETGSRSIRSLEEKLKPEGFQRCAQSFLVNLRHVDVLEKTAATLSDGTVLPVSRVMYRDFFQALVECLGE